KGGVKLCWARPVGTDVKRIVPTAAHVGGREVGGVFAHDVVGIIVVQPSKLLRQRPEEVPPSALVVAGRIVVGHRLDQRIEARVLKREQIVPVLGVQFVGRDAVLIYHVTPSHS